MELSMPSRQILYKTTTFVILIENSVSCCSWCYSPKNGKIELSMDLAELLFFFMNQTIFLGIYFMDQDFNILFPVSYIYISRLQHAHSLIDSLRT